MAQNTLLYITLAVGFSGVFGLGCAHAAVRDEVIDAWASRQARCRSVHLNWTEERFYPKHSQIRAKAPSRPAPEQATTTLVKASMKLLGAELFRFERRGRTWDPGVGDFVLREYTTVFDGESSKSFYSGAKAVAAPPTGFVREEQSDYDNRYLLPVLINLRPLHAGVGWQPDKIVVRGAATVPDGTECVVVTSSASESGFGFEFWLDPRRGYIPMRVIKSYGGRILREIDITYEDEVSSEGLWAPQSWVIQARDQDGRLVESVAAKVGLVTMNAGVDRAEFDFEFPAGTRVRDSRSGHQSTFIARGTILARSGQQRRIVTREERPGEHAAGRIAVTHAFPLSRVGMAPGF